MTEVYFEDIVLDAERQLGSYHVTKDEVVEFAKEWLEERNDVARGLDR